MATLQISKINFGKLDARDEFIDDIKDGGKFFTDSFLFPKNLNLDEFHHRKFDLICGAKGTGKTALLRFIYQDANKHRFDTHFICFKDEITEADKAKMSSDVGFKVIEDNRRDLARFKVSQDFENPMRWFLFKILYDALENKQQTSVTRDKNLKSFLSAVT